MQGPKPYIYIYIYIFICFVLVLGDIQGPKLYKFMRFRGSGPVSGFRAGLVQFCSYCACGSPYSMVAGGLPSRLAGPGGFRFLLSGMCIS